MIAFRVAFDFSGSISKKNICIYIPFVSGLVTKA